MISFEDFKSENFDSFSEKEWVMSNGLGGYSSSTVLGMNTRKYHGLFIAPFEPPWERRLLVSKLEERLVLGDKEWNLSTNQYPGKIFPKGYENLEYFEFGPFCKRIFSFSGVRVKKTIFNQSGRNAVIINYEVDNQSEKDISIEINPLINNRPIDSVSKMEGRGGVFEQVTKEKGFDVYDFDDEKCFLKFGSDLAKYFGSELLEEERWYKNMEYEKERQRGFEFREDHYNPGFFAKDLGRGENSFNILIAGGYGLEKDYDELYSENPEDFDELLTDVEQNFHSKYRDFLNEYGIKGDSWKYLLNSTESFIAENRFILAGYHWFTAWGRDSLISLPGLTLVPGEFQLAKKILMTLSNYQQQGFIPNRITSKNNELNSADASLLYFFALYKYLVYTKDEDILSELWNVLVKIIETYSRKKEGKVRMGDDGLIWTKGGLTWMDARIDGECVTPREGKTVEINSLWYNALKIMEIVSRILEKDYNLPIEPMFVRESFEEKFWNSEKNCLRDIVGKNSSDKVRPNQIFAVSLPFPVVEGSKARSIISKVEKHLLTPYGLRSLSPEDEDYIGRYEGGIENMDKAYHQGTVWSWLIGPYLSGLSRFGGSSESKREILDTLLNEHIFEAGLGSISEIFDGDEPYNPRGCVSQAWSVGEVLRGYVEDVLKERPPYENEIRGVLFA